MAVVADTIEKMIRDQLMWDNRVLSSDIEVKVSESKAILSGTVPTYYEKLAAEEDALGVAGIYFVENNIMVTFPEEIIILTDDEIKQSVQNMLKWDNRLESAKILLSVNKGVVTLEGSVDAFWKRLAAENNAYSISGVVDVINKLNVVWTNEQSDEFIAKNIKAALEGSPLINSEEIVVEVKHGVVTLKGQVLSLISKRVAAEKVAYTEGVVGFNNQIVVL